jgi:hypothetical protein
MCGCDGHYVCPRCAGTPADPIYVEDDPRDDFEQERDAFADGRSAYDPRVRP